jgi:hypothetical protein
VFGKIKKVNGGFDELFALGWLPQLINHPSAIVLA